MKRLNVTEAVDAILCMRALERVLAEELLAIEACMKHLDNSGSPLSESELEDRETYALSRAAIHGCLASITDVLGWVNLVAEKGDGSGAFPSLDLLPEVPRPSIN